jgi:hypothetical protein
LGYPEVGEGRECDFADQTYTCRMAATIHPSGELYVLRSSIIRYFEEGSRFPISFCHV